MMKAGRPSDAMVYRKLKREWKGQTPDKESLRRWRVEAEKLEKDEEHHLAGKRANCGASQCEFTDRHQQIIDDALTENCYLPDKGLAVELGVVLNTAKKYKKLAGWCTVHVRRVTLLNAKHMLDRVEWCDDNEDENFRDRSMADESTFTVMPPSTMSVKLQQMDHADSLDDEHEGGDGVVDEGEDGTPKKGPKGKKPKKPRGFAKVTDKLHPFSLMVTAVVGRPVRRANGTFKFDGKIALFPSCSTWKTAKNKSKNHAAGDTYEVLNGGTVNGDQYEQKVKDKVLPELDKWARKIGLTDVEFQDDNARSHEKARPGIVAAGTGRRSGITIRHRKQPPRSPDLNALDLYVWRVLKKWVNYRLWTVYRNQTKTVEVLWECIQHAWKNALTPAKIECAFRLLTPVMAEIKKANGNNTFKLPHIGIRTQMRAEGWDI